jgi:hypothetical protein
MKLSKLLSVALLGAVFTTSAMAAGTTAGTKITNQPTLNYSMGNKVIKDTKVQSASYVVDKVINLVIARTADYKQNLAVGESKMASFTVSNKGNSDENFLLKRFGVKQQFDFSINKFYVDADNSGIIEPKEKIDTKYIKLAKDAKATVFMEVSTDAKTSLKKVNSDGLLVQVVDASLKAYTASKTNNLFEVDVVFADGDGGADANRDGQYGSYYQWTTVQGGDVKLTIKTDYNLITADPINGACKDYDDAMSRRFKAIPGATSLKSWRITNNTETVAKNVVFKIKINTSTEKIAKDGSNIWNHGDIKDIKKHSLFVTSEHKLLSVGKFDGRDTVTYTIPEIKPGGYARPFIVTEIK